MNVLLPTLIKDWREKKEMWKSWEVFLPHLCTITTCNWRLFYNTGYSLNFSFRQENITNCRHLFLHLWYMLWLQWLNISTSLATRRCKNDGVWFSKIASHLCSYNRMCNLQKQNTWEWEEALASHLVCKQGHLDFVAQDVSVFKGAISSSQFSMMSKATAFTLEFCVQGPVQCYV